MRLKTLAVLAVLALPSLISVAVANPASADCPADTFCVYPNTNYGGIEYQSRSNGGCLQFASGIYDNAESMRNYRNVSYRMWDFPGCSGSLTYTANAQSYDSTFSNNGFSNKGSSFARL